MGGEITRVLAKRPSRSKYRSRGLCHKAHLARALDAQVEAMGDSRVSLVHNEPAGAGCNGILSFLVTMVGVSLAGCTPGTLVKSHERWHFPSKSPVQPVSHTTSA